VKFLKLGFMAVALTVLIAASDALAADGKDKWGLGGFFDQNVPLRAMKDRFGSAQKFGFNINYVMSQTATIEIEYHHSQFDHGKLEKLTWQWTGDKKFYSNPNAVSNMKWNGLAINAMIFPGEANKARGFKAKDYRYYILVGGGFYRYNNVTKNLIYPAQTTTTLNTSFYLDPQVDKRTTIAADVGVGLEGFLTDNISVDVRARFNAVIGELRPMLFYNIKQAWPLTLFDVGAGLKFYFSK